MSVDGLPQVSTRVVNGCGCATIIHSRGYAVPDSMGAALVDTGAIEVRTRQCARAFARYATAHCRRDTSVWMPACAMSHRRCWTRRDVQADMAMCQPRSSQPGPLSAPRGIAKAARVPVATALQRRYLSQGNAADGLEPDGQDVPRAGTSREGHLRNPRHSGIIFYMESRIALFQPRRGGAFSDTKFFHSNKPPEKQTVFRRIATSNCLKIICKKLDNVVSTPTHSASKEA